MNADFKVIFGYIEDPLIERTKPHKLLDIIALRILGIMTGAQNFEKIEDFGNLHEDWLIILYWKTEFPPTTPFVVLFKVINPQTFQKVFLEWIQTARDFLPEKDHCIIEN